MTNTTLREKILNELDLDFETYTPDQGMPPTVWKVNDAQLDYIISTAKREALREVRDALNSIPNTFPERESDDYDAGFQAGIAAAQMLIGNSTKL